MSLAVLLPVALQLVDEYLISDDDSKDEEVRDLGQKLVDYENGQKPVVAEDKASAYLQLLPLACEIVEYYIKSTDSTQDDRILSLVQEGSGYLAASSSTDFTGALNSSVQAVQKLTGN